MYVDVVLDRAQQPELQNKFGSYFGSQKCAAWKDILKVLVKILNI